jgi:hypothetical protein
MFGMRLGDAVRDQTKYLGGDRHHIWQIVSLDSFDHAHADPRRLPSNETKKEKCIYASNQIIWSHRE